MVLKKHSLVWCVAKQMEHMSTKLGLSFPPGYNPHIKPCRMTLEDLTFIHRPLFYYLGIRVIQTLGNTVLIFCGFQRRVYLHQWVRARLS